MFNNFIVCRRVSGEGRPNVVVFRGFTVSTTVANPERFFGIFDSLRDVVNVQFLQGDHCVVYS